MNSKRRIEDEEWFPEPPTLEDAASDPLLAALDAAELDDEPYTDDQQALAEAGRREILRGESVTLEELKMRFARRSESRLRDAG
jgi:hypothetical protein